jgi:hypothetical protein
VIGFTKARAHQAYNTGIQETNMKGFAKYDSGAILLAVLISLVAAQAVGQTSVSFGDPKAPNVLTPNVPFQGERVTKTSMRLQDGSVLVREEHELLGRDADGRFFDESFQPGTSGEAAYHHFIVADPIAKREVTWTERSTMASVTPLQVATHLNVVALPADRRIDTAMFPRDRTTVTTDDLGSKIITGVVCEGTRTVTTLAAGTIGTTTPLQRSEEVWTANDLQIVVAETDASPILGTRTVSMVSLERTAPSAERFNLPEGLAIKESALGSMPGFPDHVVLPKISSTVNIGNDGDTNGEPHMVGNGVSAPTAIFSPAAQCSDEAHRQVPGRGPDLSRRGCAGQPSERARDSSHWHGVG